MRNKLFMIGIGLVAFLVVSPLPGAFANLIYDNNITVLGSGLGAVNTLITGQDSSTPNNPKLESFGINQNGSFTPTAAFGIEGGDNLTDHNNVLSFTNNTSFAAVVNISETGQDVTVTLTDLYLTFSGTRGTHTAYYDGDPLFLTQATGTGIGGSGFVFKLDAAQYAIVAGLGDNVTISGGVQFAEGSTNDGPETVYVVQLQGDHVVPEPATLLLLGSGLLGLGMVARRRVKK